MSNFAKTRFANTLKGERIDLSLVHIHNESNKLPDHEKRMKAHCNKVQREYHNFREIDG